MSVFRPELGDQLRVLSKPQRQSSRGTHGPPPSGGRDHATERLQHHASGQGDRNGITPPTPTPQRRIRYRIPPNHISNLRPEVSDDQAPCDPLGPVPQRSSAPPAEDTPASTMLERAVPSE